MDQEILTIQIGVVSGNLHVYHIKIWFNEEVIWETEEADYRSVIDLSRKAEYDYFTGKQVTILPNFVPFGFSILYKTSVLYTKDDLVWNVDWEEALDLHR